MDRHIDKLAARARGVFQRALDDGDRVLRVAADQDDVADVAAVHLLLGDLVGVVIAAHEAQHEDQVGMRGDDGLGLLALLYGVSQRLFTEDMLASVHGQLDHIHMGGSVRDDGDRLDVGVLAQGLGVLVDGGDAQLLRDLLCAVKVRV